MRRGGNVRGTSRCPRRWPQWLTALAVVVIAGCAAGPAPPTVGSPAARGVSGRCPDVDVVFARGTNQPPGLGRVGDAFAASLLAGLPGRTVSRTAVDYPADSQQQFGIGTEDLIEHVTEVATSCPGTRFVLGGYSQGALAVSAALGVPVPGMVTAALPAWTSSRVAAVVVFGNPLGARARSIDTAPSRFRDKSVEFCNTDDPVCGGRGPCVGTHQSYPSSGATDQAARFALARLRP